MYALFQCPGIHDDVVGVAGYIQYLFNFRPLASNPLKKLQTIHARHDHVGNQQVDLFRDLPDQHQRMFRGFPDINLVAESCQQLGRHHTHHFIILDQQDCLAADIIHWHMSYGSVALLRRFIHQRKINLEGRTTANLADGRYIAVMLLDDTVHICKTKTGTMTDLLGGKKGFKNVPQGVITHAAAVIPE